MNIDDVYFPAVNGDIAELEKVLEFGLVDLNQLVDCGVTDGVKSEVPLLFSVINTMVNSAAINYQVLDMLIDYGADLDVKVVLTSDTYTFEIPLLLYAITTWNSTELLEYMLMRGASPWAEKYERYVDRGETYPMPYFAIMFRDSSDMLAILMKYGGYADQTVLTYNREEGVSQILPLLFYAGIIKESKEKTKLLCQYEANLYIETEIGFGRRRVMKFFDYVYRTYKEGASLIATTNREVIDNNLILKPHLCCPQKHPKACGVNKKMKSEAKPQATAGNQEPEQLSHIEQMRAAAAELIRYEVENIRVYDKYVYDSKVKDGSFFSLKKRQQEAQRAAEMAEYVLKERQKIVDKLNSLKNTVGTDVNDWWNRYNGMTDRNLFVNGHYRSCVVWMPFTHIVKRQGNYALTSMFVEETTVTGKVLKRFINTANAKILFCAGLSDDEEYKIAELCYWGIADATQIRNVNIYSSEREINQKLNEFNESQDDKERFLNMIAGMHYTTEEELYTTGNISDERYFWNTMSRRQRFENYENTIRSATRVEVNDADAYSHSITPLGIVAFDKDGNVAVIAPYSESHIKEWYKVDDNKVIYDMRHEEDTVSYDRAISYIVSDLKYYPLPTIDVVAPSPEGMDPLIWVKIIYSSILQEGKSALKELTRSMYLAASDEKHDKIFMNKGY